MGMINDKECIYYIVGHGPVGEYIFANEWNKKKFIDIIANFQSERQFNTYGYCIMDNHFHLIINIKRNILTDIMNEIICRFNSYYQEINDKHCEVLSWAYDKKLINDREQLLRYCRGMHQEPVKYGLVLKMEDYWWSSYRLYYRKEKGTMVMPEYILSMLDYNRKEAVRKFLEYHREFSDSIV